MTQSFRMDAVDLRLLDALQENGRLTNQELAERIGLSASQCSRRRTALEESGVIASYHALLAEERVGLAVTAFVEVSFSAHTPENAESFFRLVEGAPQIQEAYSLTGDADYLLKLTVPDLKALSHILNAVLLPHKSVARLRSFVVLERLKRTTRAPLGHLRPE